MEALLELRTKILKELRAINDADAFDQTAYDAKTAELDGVDGKIERAQALATAESRTIELPKAQRELRDAVVGGDVDEHGDVDKRSAKPAARSLTTELRDPGHYAKDSAQRTSFLADVVAARTQHDAGAIERIRENNAYGMEWRKAHQHDAEYRDLTMATDTDGGALTPVQYLQDFHAELRRAGGAALNIVNKHPLPVGTDQISIPLVSTGSTVAVHSTENAALNETDMVWGTNATANVYYTAGLQDVSLQLLEQSKPGVEDIVMRDLFRAAINDLDTDILNGSGTNEAEGIINADGIGTATYTAGTGTFQGLYAAIVNSVNDVLTGFYDAPTHILMHPRRWSWMLAQVDGSNRPQLGFNPQNTVGAFGGIAPEGTVGNLLGIPVVLDANIPTTLGSGTDEDRILVVVDRELHLWWREPKLEMDTSVGFRTNSVAFRCNIPHAFTAERYPASISVVSGTGLNDTI